MCRRDGAQSALREPGRTPCLSGTRTFDTDTPPPAAQLPAGARADTSAAARLCGGVAKSGPPAAGLKPSRPSLPSPSAPPGPSLRGQLIQSPGGSPLKERAKSAAGAEMG